MRLLAICNVMLIVLCMYGTSLAHTLNIDPKAKVVLDKLKKTFDSYSSLEMQFELSIQLPGRPTEIQKGVLRQMNEKFSMITDDQEVYADGKNIWLYIVKNKEVQISDYDGSAEGIMTPSQLLDMYNSGDYSYKIISESTVKGSQYVDIELLPTKKNTEYSKIKLSINKSQNKILSLHVFSTDGSAFKFKVISLSPNKKLHQDNFTFNKSKYPGVHIEDLRID